MNFIFQKNQPKNQKKQAIEKALSCKGWTDESKLSQLFDLAQETEQLPGDILEIGSAWGRSLIGFAFASTKNIWSIDPHTGGVAYIKREEDQNSFEEFINNIQRFNLSDRIKILKHTTSEVIELGLVSQATKFSLVWIDGLHTAEGVKTDFNFSFERLCDRGIIAFDDYFNNQFPDYTEEIDLLAQKYQLTLIKDKATKLVYCRK